MFELLMSDEQGVITHTYTFWCYLDVSQVSVMSESIERSVYYGALNIIVSGQVA